MSRRKFGKNDILINTLKSHPRSEFYIYSSSIYYNNRGVQQGQFSGDVRMTPTGFINLYEYNIDKGISGAGTSAEKNNQYIEPFISKDSSRISLSMTTASLTFSEWGTKFDYGDKITGSYPQFASIKREFITTPSASSDAKCDERSIKCSHNYSYMSLRPLLDYYGTLSEHYKVTSSFGNKDTQELNLIHIPSIFYGDKIKPGTVSLRWYLSGTLIAEIADTKQNGELIQTGNGVASSNLSGTVQGVVLYNEGFLLLTGSEIILSYPISLRPPSDTARGSAFRSPRWKLWGAGARDGITQKSFEDDTAGAGHRVAKGVTFRSASFGLSFQGESKTETMTLYARAPRGQVNYSNNPSFIELDQTLINFTSSHIYEENKNRLIKNIVTSSFAEHEENFRRQVYISKIGVYDEQKNLIGIATLADPILKDEDQDYVFKLKLDM